MDESQLKELWHRFKTEGDEDSREVLIEHYLPLVKRVAERVFFSLGRHVELDDLYSSGLLGLMDCMGRYVPSRQIKFETFSSHRIRGAMLDDVRSKDWVPRLARASQQKYQKAYQELLQELQRRPTDEEMRGLLKMDEEAFHRLCEEANILSMASINELSSGEDQAPEQWIKDERPERDAKKRERREFLDRIVRLLPEREQQMLVMYYLDELTLKEISQVFSLTEGRVSQILSSLLAKLREQCGEIGRDYLE